MVSSKIFGIQLTTENVTDILYFYFVKSNGASQVIEHVLGVSKQTIRNKYSDIRKVYQELESTYSWFGIQRKYAVFKSNQTPYRKITKAKLYNYVCQYWNKGATEADLIRFFPEIKSDLEEAKRIYYEKSLEDHNSSGKHRKQSGNPSPAFFDDDEAMDDSSYSNARYTDEGSFTGNGSYTDDFSYGGNSSYDDNSFTRYPVAGTGSYRNGSGTVRSYGRFASGYSEIFRKILRFAIMIAVVIGIVFLIKGIINSIGSFGFNSVGKRRSTFGKDFDVEYYNYDRKMFLGKAKKETPDGINLYYENLQKDNGKFSLAEFDKEEMNLEGAVFDGYTLTIGRMKKSRFTGSWCVRSDGGQVILAYFKDNQPTGVGIYRAYNETKIVNFSKDKKLIATYSDGKWLKPNGKELRLGKNNKYKKMFLNDDVNISVKNIDFCIDMGKLEYRSDTFDFSGKHNNFTANYYSKKNYINVEYVLADHIRMTFKDYNGAGFYRELRPSED